VRGREGGREGGEWEGNLRHGFRGMDAPVRCRDEHETHFYAKVTIQGHLFRCQ